MGIFKLFAFRLWSRIWLFTVTLRSYMVDFILHLTNIQITNLHNRHTHISLLDRDVYYSVVVIIAIYIYWLTAIVRQCYQVYKYIYIYDVWRAVRRAARRPVNFSRDSNVDEFNWWLQAAKRRLRAVIIRRSLEYVANTIHSIDNDNKLKKWIIWVSVLLAISTSK